MRYTILVSALFVWILVAAGCATAGASTGASAPRDLQAAAERTGGRATTTYPEVARLVQAIAAQSPLAHATSLGDSYEGRPMPMLVIADPPVTTPAQANDSGKVVAYLFGGIHSGEACGKEALLQLARELALDPDRPDHRVLLDNLIILIVPLYNPDGDVRRAPGNRPGQIGPVDGMGQRANAQSFDLNRDHIKLESPEARAQVNLLNTWDPHLIIDTHTTNGSYHRLDLTYAPPLNPSGDERLLSFVQDTFLPEVERRMRSKHGLETAPYGNFNRDKTTWTTYSANPMFGGPYRGLRNRISILSEAYAYATFAERVFSTEMFVRECLLLAAEQPNIVQMHTSNPLNVDIVRVLRSQRKEIGIKHDLAPPSSKRTIPGWLETLGDSDRMIPTGAHREYEVDVLDRFIATKSVQRPRAYLIPPGLGHVVIKLQQHGIRVDAVTDSRASEVELNRIQSIERSEREFQGHRMVQLATVRELGIREIGPGWSRVDSAQPLGVLAVYMLEPDSDGGLAAWNFFDDWIEEGEFWPIVREPF
jgi:dipeptidyl-peptidase-4